MLRTHGVFLALISLMACSSDFSKKDQAFGNALKADLQAQKIQSSHRDEQSEVTAQEMVFSFDAYQQGKTVQSNSGDQLASPMIGSNNNSSQ